MSDLGLNEGAGDEAAPPEGALPTGKPGGPPPNIQQLVASKRLQQAQAQVGEVVDIMRVNVEKVLERDQKISELDRRADDLQEGASQFQQQAVKLKRKYWWENVKMWLIIAIILLVIVIIVVVSTTGQGAGNLPNKPVTDIENAQDSSSNDISAESAGNQGPGEPNHVSSGGGNGATQDASQPAPAGNAKN